MLLDAQDNPVARPIVIGGIQYPPNIEQLWSDEELLAIGLHRVPDPPSTLVTFNDWLALFTTDERVWAFSSNDPNVREMIARGAADGTIDLASPTVAAFLDLCISLGSPLTAPRKAQVLAGEAPT